MARHNPPRDPGLIYAAVEKWSEDCLQRDASILDENLVLWRVDLLRSIDRSFTEYVDQGDGDFFDKLKSQLASCPSDCAKLMAEMLWLLMLFQSNIRSTTKRENIVLVWSWSNDQLAVENSMLSDAVLQGIGSPGTAYNTHRWLELRFLISMTLGLKERDNGDRAKLLSDPWLFGEWIGHLPGSSNRQLRHIVLHLLFPDTYERIGSARDKARILRSFDGFSEKGRADIDPLTLDRDLLALRNRLEAERGSKIDFYDKDIAALWRDSATPKPNEPESTPPRSDTPARGPSNLILYGPPGTGKTYATAREAVLLCNGSAPADRHELMEAYAKLAEAGRIEFVTFHQSYSYEDFVEGLRPIQAKDGSGGFSLEPRMGAFRRIARRAETSTGVAQAEYQLGDRNVFKMSLGEASDPDDASIFEEAIEEGCVLIDWDDKNWSDVRYSSKETILKACQSLRGEDGAKELSVSSGWVQSSHIFRNVVGIGDIIVVSRGNSLFRAIGEVTGPYQYVRRPDGRYPHRRTVRWLWHDTEGVPVDEIYQSGFSQKTIYRLADNQLRRAALQRYASSQADNAVAGSLDQFVMIIDEINRANISKVFGELITLLEADKRLGAPNALHVQLPYSQETVGVPSNLHIIGTMNTADRSIALLDTALRRRFEFRELMPAPEELVQASATTGINLVNMLSTMNERVEYLFDREHQIGHAYFMSCTTREEVDAVMRHKIIPLLAEYFYEDWSKVAAVLGDTGGDGAFLERTLLRAPEGLAQEPGHGERYRWIVKPAFSPDCYDRFR